MTASLRNSFSLVVLSALLAGCTRGAPPPQSAALVIAHVDIVDGRSAAVRRDRTIVIEGSRIAAEGAAASVTSPRGARVIDGRGRYLIPGLWDMHVHNDVPAGEQLLPLYIANGVTGVRDMAGNWNTLTTWRRDIMRGDRIGPRMVLSGPYLEGGAVPIPHLLVRGPDDAQSAVDSLLALGTGFVKVHTQLDRATYFAIARAARLRRVPFAGHVPRTVSAAEASDSGQSSIEHLLTIPNQCTPAESTALAPRFRVQSALGNCSSANLEPLFQRFVRNRTWMVPTLVAAVEIARWPKRDLPGDSFAEFIPDTLRGYVRQIFPMPDDVPADADVTGNALFAKRVAVTGALHRAGVGIMAGTDAPLRNSPPGFGLHAELAMLVRAGLTPFDALRAATLHPAEFFAATDSLGTIEAGKLADLVLLDANPLDDIAHARRIVAVIANGRLFEIRRETGNILVDGVPLPRWPVRASR